MNRRKYYFLLLLAGLFWVSCEKKVASPPATATATNTTTVAAAKDTPTLQVNFAGLHYYSPAATYKQNVLNISGQYMSGPASISTDPYFSVVVVSFYAKSAGTYLLSIKNMAYIAWGWHVEGTRGLYQTDSIHTGNVILTGLDTVHHIASGTFYFVGGALTPPALGPATDTCSGTFTNVTW